MRTDVSDYYPYRVYADLLSAGDGRPIVAASAPTYGEAFLGNTLNGQSFYTNIPGKPALYQTAQGTQTNINITNIQVTDENGNQAIGWEFVTGDAETTDTTSRLHGPLIKI